MVKRGFSLAEALVVMGILSIILGFAAKTVTVKPAQRQEQHSHGYYECYNDGGWKQRYLIDGAEIGPTDVVGGVCRFTLRPGIALFWIQARADNNYYSLTEPNVNRDLSITFNGRNRMVINGSELIPNEGMTGEHLENHLRATYADSMLCNGSVADCDLRNGVIISW